MPFFKDWLTLKLTVLWALNVALGVSVLNSDPFLIGFEEVNILFD